MLTTARFTVMWDTPSDPEAFDRHYREVHLPLGRQLPGLRRYTLSRNVVLIRGEGPLYVVAELDWDDMAALRRAFESPAGRATADDAAQLARYAAVRSLAYELEDHLR
jgi:uncharacterized protein (TIGR02118 family)